MVNMVGVPTRERGNEDDMVLLYRDPEQLRQWHRRIAAFLQERLRLELRPDMRLAPVGRGVDFLGYIVRPHYTLVRRRVIGNLYERLHAFEQAHIRPCKSAMRISQQDLEGLRTVFASYLGHFRHADSHRLIASLWQEWPWLGLWLSWQPHRQRMLPLWKPRQVSGYRSQVRYFRATFPFARVVVQRGCELDSFPPWAGTHDLCRDTTRIRHGVRQVNVVEAGYLEGGLKQRVVDSIYLDSGVRLCRN
jgi:hypothetical protein